MDPLAMRKLITVGLVLAATLAAAAFALDAPSWATLGALALLFAALAARTQHDRAHTEVIIADRRRRDQVRQERRARRENR